MASAPAHGTATGSYTTIATGGTLMPTGLSYTPAPGFTGSDTFKIQVSDCGYIKDTVTFYVMVADCALTSPQPSPRVERGTLRVWPNPVNEELNIQMGKDEFTAYNISNTMGQVMMQHPLHKVQTKVDVKMLPAGLYYITLKGAAGSVVKKFVKM